MPSGSTRPPARLIGGPGRWSSHFGSDVMVNARKKSSLLAGEGGFKAAPFRSARG
jgi:hypothetical protein